MENRYGWVIAAAGAVITCVAMGRCSPCPSICNRWPRRPADARRHFRGHDRRLHRHGRRRLRLGHDQRPDRRPPGGAHRPALLGLGLAVASTAPNLVVFPGRLWRARRPRAAPSFAPLMATTVAWFDRHRSLAVSLVSIGGGVAPMVITPLASILISTYGWRSAMLMTAVGASLVLIPAALLIRRAPVLAAAAASCRPGEDLCQPSRRCARRSSSCWRPPSSSAPRIPGRSSTP